MSLIHPRYAWIGNADNTPFPIVDPKTGEEVPIWKGHREDRLAKEHLHWAGAVEFFRRIRDLTGKNLFDVSRSVLSDNGEKTELIQTIRRQIHLTTAVLRELPPDTAQKLLAQYGALYNTMWLDDIVRRFAGDLEHELDQKNEVYACNDAARLLLMMFDTRFDPRVRYEARRKFALMEMMLELEHYGEEDVDHDNALNDFFEFLNQEVLTHEKGEKIGAGVERFLVSNHDLKNDHKTLSATIQDKEPRHSPVSRKVKPIQMRCMTVSAERGKERKIWFHVGPRAKSTTSRLIKTLRYGTEIGEKDSDRNGLRLVFEREEDIHAFFAQIKAGFSGTVQIEIERNNLHGGEQKEKSHGGSPLLPLLEYKITFWKRDGTRQPFDCHIFLPKGFADYAYRKGMSWTEYGVNRFYAPQKVNISGRDIQYEGVHEMLCPVAIYGHPHRAHFAEEMRARAFRALWSKNGAA